MNDDVLTLLALRDPVARLLTGLDSLGAIGDAADQAIEEGPTVVIASVYSDPLGEIAEGEHGGHYYELCVPRGKHSRTIVVDDKEMTLGAFLNERLDDATRNGWIASGETVRATPLDPAPSLVAARAVQTPPAAAIRVHHPKFGEGTTPSFDPNNGASKTVVTFDDGVTRTLLARFLTRIPHRD